MRWFTYILKCSDGSLYVGMTRNLKTRIIRHNAGKGCRYTQAKRPVVLLWYEISDSMESVMARERQIKGWTREKKLNLIRLGNPNGMR